MLFTRQQLVSWAKSGHVLPLPRSNFPPSFCLSLLTLPCPAARCHFVVASRSSGELGACLFFFLPLLFWTLSMTHQCGHSVLIGTLSSMIGTFEQARSQHDKDARVMLTQWWDVNAASFVGVCSRQNNYALPQLSFGLRSELVRNSLQCRKWQCQLFKCLELVLGWLASNIA